jgi:hypothetical protein
LRPIGVMTDDRAVNVIGADEKPVRLKLAGYDHFA